MSKKITQTNYSYEEDRVSTFFGLLLFSIAALALYFVCVNFSSKPTTSEYQHQVEKEDEFLLSSNTDSETAYVQPTAQTSIHTAPQALAIEGIKEVGQPIQFTIKHFSPEAQYRIDFGNGTFHEVTQQNVVYTYNRPARYQVQVQVEYKGEVKTISSHHLNIFEAIEMKASVSEIEF